MSITTRPRASIRGVSTTLIAATALAGCGGGSSGDSADAASSPVDTACLKKAGFTDQADAGYVGLEGAKKVFADADAGVTIYEAETAADAKRIADASQASEAHGSKGRLLFISTSADAPKVSGCL